MENKSVTSVVSIFLDVFRPELKKRYGSYEGDCSAEWTRNRIEFFQEWTLKSLHNQSFQDFRIFMLCSKESKPLIDSYTWDTNIEHCYDYGKASYEALDTDYVSITRLDTDDLLHRDALKTIRENLVLSDKVETMFFADYFRWLFHHDCFVRIADPFKDPPAWSPSYTLVFPKAIYKNWENIRQHWFVVAPEIFANSDVKILPSDMVCQIRIKESTHHRIHREDPLQKARLEEELQIASRFERTIFSSNERIEILKKFGIFGGK